MEISDKAILLHSIIQELELIGSWSFANYFRILLEEEMNKGQPL